MTAVIITVTHTSTRNYFYLRWIIPQVAFLLLPLIKAAGRACDIYIP